ncbi:MAG TPA: hypothetical protein VGR24_12355 [bacterium]|nr:hypothetical protein [bacterium]
MKRFLVVAALLIAAIAIFAVTKYSGAQGVPNLKGTWSGTFRSVIYGSNVHHPGSQTIASPPRVRSIRFTFDITGQDGRLLWGTSRSSASPKEPFAATMTADLNTILGADTDGLFGMRVISQRRIELCYAHSALSPSRSIVASCGTLERTR